MEKFEFPEKPKYKFTNQQLTQRNEILNKQIEHIKYELKTRLKID